MRIRRKIERTHLYSRSRKQNESTYILGVSFEGNKEKIYSKSTVPYCSSKEKEIYGIWYLRQSKKKKKEQRERTFIIVRNKEEKRNERTYIVGVSFEGKKEEIQYRISLVGKKENSRVQESISFGK